MSKIKMVKITLERAEGPADLTGKPVTFNTWKEANWWLQKQAVFCTDLGSDKTDFVVTYEDGQTYKGTYGLEKEDMFRSNMLEKHMKSFLEAVASGKWDRHQPGISQEAKKFLERYEIGEE